MPTYKLQYFDCRGRGELSRYVFHAAGKDFEDARYTFETWPTIKPTTPFGQIPVLHVDGKQLGQSGAIARFLAREFGLAGKNSWQQALVDQYLELTVDMFKEIDIWFFEKDEEKKKEIRNNLKENIFPKYCGFLQNALEQNGGKYFVGSDLTLADLAVFEVFETPMLINPKLLDSFPLLKAHRHHIESLPNIAEYIKNRKKTDI